jgi:hypothetical protein
MMASSPPGRERETQAGRENLGKSAAALFEAGGHDTQTVCGQGLSRAADREVIAACQAEQRCHVTLDLDFANPLLFDPALYAGIAVLRLPAKPSYEDLLQQCETRMA